MNKSVIIIGTFVLAAFLATKEFGELPIAKLTLKVTDENAVTVQSANVIMSFEQPSPTWGSGVPINVTGQTDENGKFTGVGHSFDSKGGQVSKVGYYTTWAEPFKFRQVLSGKWQPWNPSIEVILRKIVQPVPMYAKHVNLGMPAFGTPVGYDLMVGDWVAPYGRGSSSDLLFTAVLDKRAEKDFDYSLKVTFPNQGDGIQLLKPIQGSEFKSPREAPKDGYLPEWNQVRRRRPNEPEQWTRDENRNYFFRIRSMTDNSGNVISALYGKIYGDFMTYFYYLNPTPNDRNMEFDPKRNLFTNLKADERVTQP